MNISGQTIDLVSIRIDEKLGCISRETSKPCIFRVYAELRNENEKAYEPQIVAIGPYHRGKNNLQETEKHKLLYLKLLLQRRKELTVDRYVRAIGDLEKSARKCYAETINLSINDFVEMMILDGCFIIELLRKVRFKELRDMNPDDPVFQRDHVIIGIIHDLMLFENQLPFFILDVLFNMTKNQNPLDNIISLALDFLGSRLPGPKVSETNGISADNVNHLLHLVHSSWCYSFARKYPFNGNQKWSLELIKSTIELRESGIKFKNDKESTSVLDIKFGNGVMKIPPLDIDDRTECVLRNLIAYEQYFQGIEPRYVTDYMKLMDCLINSAKDAEILRHCGIINNWLGDDEAISSMFNKLGNNVYTSAMYFCYCDVFHNVNKHCRQRRNIRLAKLRHNYFNSPWSTISFFAAAALLLLTLAQTIISALSYWKPK
ncbi:hypothetical protein F0562_028262 [Nyssa sinensis]|uniref:Uncharacterized protein n=1 Tax=Nyssa sinensis TaxID=561372 RepID=A0A5J5B7U1_9ASTE|nr:hypothetical protein F0562_028262 [Nyssa sinensis]